MEKRVPVIGPTFEEMLNPEKIDPKIRKRAIEMKKKDPLHPINLFNISWKDENNEFYYFVMPKELTGVDANIIVLYAKEFPSGSHKVGPAYSVLAEKTVFGEVDPTKHTLIWPSTGNYCRGGAFNSALLTVHAVAILPEEMSQERFDWLRNIGAEVYATPGCESNVKEIYDKCHELEAESDEYLIFNQFDQFGNSIWHYEITGNTIDELFNQLKEKKQRLSAYVSATGSAGTIAAGDYLRKLYPQIKFYQMDAVRTGFCDAQFDTAFMIMFLHEVVSDKVIGECCRIAGEVVVIDYSRILYGFMGKFIKLIEKEKYKEYAAINLTKKFAEFGFSLKECRSIHQNYYIYFFGRKQNPN